LIPRDEFVNLLSVFSSGMSVSRYVRLSNQRISINEG